MKKVYMAFAMLLPFCAINAQAPLFFNNGSVVTVTTGGIVYVDGTVDNASGTYSNAGQTTVKSDFVNNGTATGGNAAGQYLVYGNWENNDVFTADQSAVYLKGQAQEITGSQVTTFHDLLLDVPASIKTQTIDANVNHLLNFEDGCELATHDFRMTVTNPGSAAILVPADNLTAFVSSTGNGRLVRAANSTDTYLFPTGWNVDPQNWTILYRPVELTPSATDAQSFEVRMANGDASLEGYDTSMKAPHVIGINGKFFHYVKQVGATSPADLSIYYSPSADGDWTSIGRWETPSNPHWWDDLQNTVTGQSSVLSRRTKTMWADNGQQPHVLVHEKPIDFVFNFPNVFDPGSNDPLNQTFHVIDQYNLVTMQEMKIFDRWGEVVFDSQRDGRPDWDGKYHGKAQPMGNYVYTASVKVNSTSEIKTAKGNLTLLW